VRYSSPASLNFHVKPAYNLATSFLVLMLPPLISRRNKKGYGHLLVEAENGFENKVQKTPFSRSISSTTQIGLPHRAAAVRRTLLRITTVCTWRTVLCVGYSQRNMCFQPTGCFSGQRNSRICGYGCHLAAVAPVIVERPGSKSNKSA
jgi:hypothetical protein